MAEPTPPVNQALQMKLLPDEEIGVFADFALVWHTPNTFVLDFLAVLQPPRPAPAETGQGGTILDARVAARVRIPPEQIFRLAEALQQQAHQWMAETNRGEVPPAWAPPSDPQPPAA
jgi:hypothetical protein